MVGRQSCGWHRTHRHARGDVSTTYAHTDGDGLLPRHGTPLIYHCLFVSPTLRVRVRVRVRVRIQTYLRV